MRIPVVAGNWKMNPTSLAEALALAEEVAVSADGLAAIETVVCPPTIWLEQIAAAVAGRRVAVGAQTMHWEEKGAFTGETSPAMLAGVARFVIIGHSERRQYDGETDERVGLKVV